jgi:hypothetical protein
LCMVYASVEAVSSGCGVGGSMAGRRAKAGKGGRKGIAEANSDRRRICVPVRTVYQTSS